MEVNQLFNYDLNERDTSSDDYCFLCSLKKSADCNSRFFLSENNNTVAASINNNDKKLKELILEITKLGSSSVNINDGTFCKECRNDVQLFQEMYETFQALQQKLNCLSTVISYRFLKSLRSRQSSSSVLTEEGNNSDDKEWDIQFHKWNFSRLEHPIVTINKSSVDILEDGYQLIGRFCKRSKGIDDGGNGDNLSYKRRKEDVESQDIPLVHIEDNYEHDHALMTLPVEPIVLIDSSNSPLDGKTSGSSNLKQPESTVNNELTSDGFFRCKECPRLFINEEYLNSHMAEHTIKTYNCKDCDKSYKYYGTLWNHVKQHHSKTKTNGYSVAANRQLQCPVCLIKLNSKYHTTLMGHLYCYHKNCEYRCLLCSSVFDTPKKFVSHLNIHEGEFKCTSSLNCNRAFKTQLQLNKHEESHLNDNSLFRCDYCHKTFEKQYILNIHISKKHSQVMKNIEFICEQCGKLYGTSKHLSAHAECHKPKDWKCGNCDSSFRTGRALKVHQFKMHNDKMAFFACEYCQLPFKTQKGLDRHVKKHAKKTGVKYWECKFCDDNSENKYFRFKREFMAHLSKTHPLEYNPTNLPSCEICWKLFESEEQLTRHNLEHLKFKCKICGHQFLHKFHFVEHMLRHGSIRPFKCSKCGKGFYRSGRKIQHEKFKCPLRAAAPGVPSVAIALENASLDLTDNNTNDASIESA